MLTDVLTKYSLYGNWVDVVFIVVIIYFIFTSRGFIESLVELFGLVVSIIFSYQTYTFFGKLITDNFTISQGIAKACGFFIGWIISEAIISAFVLLIFSVLPKQIRTSMINRSLRFIPSAVHAVVVYIFFVSLIFSFPVRGSIKSDILHSKKGPFFIGISRSFETKVKNVFGGAVTESLNFITVKPKSDERIALDFRLKEKDMSYDFNSEKIMLDLINKERKKHNLKALVSDDGLRLISRKYAKQMLTYGFFSHESPVDGTTAAQRTQYEGIYFEVVGENLAFAPDVYLAHQGLMNSDGHRANILAEEFGRVGVGVIDGGIYGRMFVQVFTD